MKHIVIPIFVPHKGCPFDCIYCNQKLISGQVEEMNEDKMREIIESHLQSSASDTYVEIGFFGGSFTGIDRDQQFLLLEIANEYIKSGYVKEIRLSTRPDYINIDVLNYLKDYNVKTVELGAQSLDDDVLAQSCRGHSKEDVIKSSKLIRQYGIKLGIQTMIGLPGDIHKKALATAQMVVALQPDIVRIYPTLVIRGTYLEKMYYQEIYKPLNMDEAVDLCAELLELYNKNNIKVIRIGLQPTENINNDMDVVAGPFHPAIRQLVESKLMLKYMERKILTEKLTTKKNIVIHASSKNISNIIGQKKSNILYLKQKYNFETVSVKTDKLQGNEVNISSIPKILR